MVINNINRSTVVHFTSLHLRNDTRIFYKECVSLAKDVNNKVVLIVADGLGNEHKDSVEIVDIGLINHGRLLRAFVATLRLLKKIRSINPDVCHFHDPELLPSGLFLKLIGKKVVYDVHEDLPRQILSKEWVPKFFRVPLSFMVEIFEDLSSRCFDLIVTATPHINERFKKTNTNSFNINNYPLLEEVLFLEPLNKKNRTVCYIGGLTRIRGLLQVMKGLELCDATLILAGDFNDKKFEAEIKACPAWNKVQYLGSISREEVVQVLKSCAAGIVTFLPEPNHIYSQPNKMFEYMAASLPVVASDFPLWREIIEGNKCGVCVDPNDPSQIAKAINYILDNYDETRQLGLNGFNAIQKKYNWNVEEKKLLELYTKLL